MSLAQHENAGPQWRQSLRQWHERWPRLLPLFGGVMLPMLLFGAFAEDIWDDEPLRLDDPILQRLHAHATPARDHIVVLLTQLGSGNAVTAIALVVGAWLLWKRRPFDALFLGLAIGGAGLLNWVSKLIFGRDRPDLFLSPAPEEWYSFPSGHAMGSMALALAITILAWHTRWRWPVFAFAAIWVVTVGLTRMYLGVHFPSDVLGGWCAATAWVFGLHSLLRKKPPMNTDEHG